MGGRGAYSASYRAAEGVSGGAPANTIPHAPFNRAVAGRASEELTVGRFAQLTKNSKREKVIVLDSRGYAIAAAVGDGRSVGIPAPKRGKIAAIVHNHPGTYGGTFSDHDIRAFGNYYKRSGTRTLYATAKEGTYSLKVKSSRSDVDGFAKAYNDALPKLNRQASRRGKAFGTRQGGVDVYHAWFTVNARKFGIAYKRKK
jgi:hypothetical protein